MAKSPKGTSTLKVKGKSYEIRLNHGAIFDIDAFLEREGYPRSFIQGFIESPASAFRLTVAFHFGSKPATKSVKDAVLLLQDVPMPELLKAIQEALEAGGVLSVSNGQENVSEGEA